MGTKSNIISTIMFAISSVLFVVFAMSIFLGGQVIAGSVYLLYFATSVAFAFLSKKYHSNFISIYRYSAFLSDFFNILAVATIVHYGEHLGIMVAVLSILVVGLVQDVVATNRLEKRRIANILVNLFNLVLMISCIPYFFVELMSLTFAIIALVMAVAIMVLKVVLDVVPFKGDGDVVDRIDCKDCKDEAIEESLINQENKENDIE